MMHKKELIVLKIARDSADGVSQVEATAVYLSANDYQTNHEAFESMSGRGYRAQVRFHDDPDLSWWPIEPTPLIQAALAKIIVKAEIGAGPELVRAIALGNWILPRNLPAKVREEFRALAISPRTEELDGPRGIAVRADVQTGSWIPADTQQFLCFLARLGVTVHQLYRRTSGGDHIQGGMSVAESIAIETLFSRASNIKVIEV